MLQEHKALDVLQRLIHDSRDAQDGYRDAAEYIRDQELRAFFIEQSLERGSFASKLQSKAQRLGSRYRRPVGSWVHQRWIDAQRHLRSGDQGLLEAMESGEARVRQ